MPVWKKILLIEMRWMIKILSHRKERVNGGEAAGCPEYLNCVSDWTADKRRERPMPWGGAFCLFTTPRLWVYFVLAGDLMFVCLPVIVRVTLCEGSIVSSILDRVLSTHLCVPWNGLFRHMHLNP